MLPSTRNGSGTLRSDIYYSTVFLFIKLVSTKFFKKSSLFPAFRLKTSPPALLFQPESPVVTGFVII